MKPGGEEKTEAKPEAAAECPTPEATAETAPRFDRCSGMPAAGEGADGEPAIGRGQRGTPEQTPEGIVLFPRVCGEIIVMGKTGTHRYSNTGGCEELRFGSRNLRSH